MQQMNNISMFLKGCQDLGLPSGSCFDPMRDVHEAKDSSKVLNCLSSLGGICQSKSISVPAFGKSNFAKANKREWTTEQLKEQKEQDRGTMLNNGSASTMERQAISKGGITFGSTFGAGSGEGTMLNNGSSGTMERQAVSKGGITFGNDHAGAGSGEATMFDKAIAAGTASPKDAAPPEPPSPKDASPPEPPEPPTDEEDA